MKKKKPFLLLEILIAILIVSICLIPLIHQPMQSYRREIRLLEEMEGERLADVAFSEIKQQLLTQSIAWEKLPAPKGVSESFSLPATVLHIPGCISKEIQRTFVLSCGAKGEKEGAQGELFRILRVDIQFHPNLCKKKSYIYRIGVKKYKTVDQKRLKEV